MSSSQRSLHSPTAIRDRLAALVQADPLLTPTDGVTPRPFPGDIIAVDPANASAAGGAKLSFVVPGFNLSTATLGPRGTGRLAVTAQLVVGIYVPNVPDDSGDTETALLAARGEISSQVGDLTALVAEAIFHYQVDPTPGDQWWNILRLVPTQQGLDVIFFETPSYFGSSMRITLSGQQTRS